MATDRALATELGGNLQPLGDINHSTTHNNRNVREDRHRKNNLNDSIIFMTINAQSLKHKNDDLKTKAKEHKPLIIGVTETWANEEIDDGVFKLDTENEKEKYVMYRGDRVGGRGEEHYYIYQHSWDRENA